MPSPATFARMILAKEKAPSEKGARKVGNGPPFTERVNGALRNKRPGHEGREKPMTKLTGEPLRSPADPGRRSRRYGPPDPKEGYRSMFDALRQDHAPSSPHWSIGQLGGSD